MRFHLISVVWGKDFLDFFLRVTLPNQLSKGNLSAFAGTESTYKIYTDEQDAEVIRTSESFRQLEELMHTEIISIDHLQHSNKYNRMTLCHKWAIYEAYHDNACVVLLPSDVIYAENSLTYLMSIAQTGKPVIMMAAPRILRESFIPAAFETCFDSSTGAISANSRQLMQLAMKHLHPVTLSIFYNTKDANEWPSQLYFAVPGSGFIAHCFHLHPLMFIPLAFDTSFEGTIDADYLLNTYQDVNDIHILDDSDLFLALEPCDASYRLLKTGTSFDLQTVNIFVRENTDAHHRQFVTHPILFHYTDISPAWIPVEETANLFINMFLKYAD